MIIRIEVPDDWSLAELDNKIAAMDDGSLYRILCWIGSDKDGSIYGSGLIDHFGDMALGIKRPIIDLSLGNEEKEKSHE